MYFNYLRMKWRDKMFGIKLNILYWLIAKCNKSLIKEADWMVKRIEKDFNEEW